MRFFTLLPVLVALAFLEIFIGGARLLYAIPGISLVAITAILTINWKIKANPRSDHPALIASLLFAGYILIRNRFSEVEYIARLQFFIMAGCLIIYLIFTVVFARAADRNRLFLFLGILALLQMVPALVQFSSHDPWMPLSWAQRQDHGNWRASGFFISPNNFAGFLEVMALFAMSYAIWGRTTLLIRIILGYCALVFVAGVAISGSRGGYLSLVFGSAVLLLFSLIAWRRMQRENFALAALLSSVGALALFSAILLIVFLSPTLGERVQQINDPENMRLLLWKSALQQFHLSPIWGTGGFSFLYFGRLFRDPTVQNDPIHVHDDYLQLLADYGLVGMGLFLLLLITHLRAGGISFLKLTTPSPHSPDLQSDRLAMNIGSLSAVAAYMVHSLVDFNMQLPLNALMMTVVFAVLANAGTPFEDSRSQQSLGGFRKSLRYSLPLLGLALLLYGIPMIRGEYLAERARIALRDGHPQEALEWSRKGTIKTHDNPELYYYRGEAALELVMMGNPKGQSDLQDLKFESVSAFLSGLKVFPYDSRLALKLAQAQAVAGDYFSALESIDYAQRLDPNSAFVPAYKGIVHYYFNHLDEARVAFSQSVDLGGQGALIAQRGLKLVDHQEAENLKLEGTPPHEILQNTQAPAPTEPPSPQPSEGDVSGGDLMHAVP